MKSNQELLSNPPPRLRISQVAVDGGCGYIFGTNGKPWATVIWSFGAGWEHVSVAPLNRKNVPSWDDMCRLKDMFFYEDEAVMQLHPPKSEYVNNVQNCLHLWRPTAEALPLPPSIMVGIKAGQTMAEVKSAIAEVIAAEDKEFGNA